LGDQPCGKGGCSLAVTWLVLHGSVPATTGWMPLDERPARVAWRVIQRISRSSDQADQARLQWASRLSTGSMPQGN